ncbi:response regulator [Devosia sp. J2-20]|jgi:CheY-like chemotaxis protein|uniref:Response regulator n=1 Tax=Devosia litorisediminis TaxID=2829817 RepID=A0A942E7Q8_9HYPH|nr:MULTISPECIES: response regulator [Devosia]MBS3847364.1 response regulator [Devosia litorisediminis]MCZ4346736.1 response regulator [Devosia neptuniae]WDQ99508.1 response regulator [Devosia sp. J2-20]|tara:strand:+ start:1775 stop:2167 length:393 start_codon:yes stop_codon:yes gene_type:complete
MAQPLRLLAVDDDVASAELIVRVAERCGYEAFATSDSRGVINLVAALRPDVMAVDISMPHVDAIELFRLLAEHRYQGKIVIVSGQDDQTLLMVQRSAELMGLQQPHIHQKPLDFMRLRETLNANRMAIAS